MSSLKQNSQHSFDGFMAANTSHSDVYDGVHGEEVNSIDETTGLLHHKRKSISIARRGSNVSVRRSNSTGSALSAEAEAYDAEIHHDEGWKGEFWVLFHLSWPVTLTAVLEFLPSITTTIFVGHMGGSHDQEKGKTLLAGASLASMFINIFGVSIGFGLACGLDTLCAQANGAGDKRQVGRWFQRYLIILTLIFIPVAFANWFSEPILVHVLKQPKEAAVLAQVYTRYGLLITPALWLYELLKKVFLAQGLTLQMIMPAIIMNICNVVVSYLFAFHTDFGLEGQALARAGSTCVSPIVMGIYIWWTGAFKHVWPENGWGREVFQSWGTAFKLGVPAMLMMCLEWWAFEYQAVFCGLLPENSVIAIDAHTILFNLTGFTYMWFLGIAVAVSIHVANLLGAGQPKRAKTSSMVGVCMCGFFGVLACILIASTIRVLPYWFTTSEEVAEVTRQVIPLLAAYQVFDSVQAIFGAIFRGSGLQIMGAGFMFVGYYIVGLPVCYVCAFVLHMGVFGVWLGPTSALLLVSFTSGSVLLFYIDFNKLSEQAIKRVEDNSEQKQPKEIIINDDNDNDNDNNDNDNDNSDDDDDDDDDVSNFNESDALINAMNDMEKKKSD